MLTSEAGDRPDAPNVVVVLTDGGSSNMTATQVWKLLKNLLVLRNYFELVLSLIDCKFRMVYNKICAKIMKVSRQ